nr:reverse transcriptase domain-containing protein [Tanacetum cinerariifolium]
MFFTLTSESNREIRRDGSESPGHRDPEREAVFTRLGRKEKGIFNRLREYPEQTIATGSTLTWEGQKELCGLLRRNLDIFAWKPVDMTRVPWHVAEHRLNVCEGYPPVRQMKRSQAPERNMAIQEECKRLMQVGIMKKVHYHNWLSNPLNPKKCTFGVEEGMFLGYMVNTKGIKVFPDKVEAVLSLPSPKCLKDVQRLNGKLASLNRFLAKLSEKSLPFFKTLKKCTKKSDFQWTTKAEAAFKQIKKLTAELPTLTTPMEKEELIVYLAAAREAVSAVLVTEREENQMSINFVSRALQDFIVERPEDDSLAAPMEVEEELSEPWTLFTDGSSCVHGFRAGLILTNPEGTKFTYALRFEFNATNNEAEYEALIVGLRITNQMGINNLHINVDSLIVANQVNGSYIAKEPSMIQYLEKVKTVINSFKKFLIKKVLRSKNKKADALSKTASTNFVHLTKQVLVELLKEKSINEAEVLTVMEEEGNTWMTPIYKYLTEEILPKKRRRQGRYGSNQYNNP